MTIQIREATAADYPAIAAVLTATNLSQPVTAELLQASADKTNNHPKGLHLAQWVAEQDSKIVGFAGVTQWAGSHHPDRYNVRVDVPPPFERQGIGAALAETVQAHLQRRGAREVLAGASESEPHAVAFLLGRGFAELEREFANILDLSGWQPMQAELPTGYRLLSVPQLIAEQGEAQALEAFRQCFNEARTDEPRQIPAQPYSTEDIQAYITHPTFFPEGIWLAVTDKGEVAALTELWQDLADPQSLNTGLTGTARQHRRKGLALALKIHSLNLAAARGIRKVVTHNATTNAPMLAINERLGFTPEPAFIQMIWGGLED